MPVGRGEEKTPVLNRGFFVFPAVFILILDQFLKGSIQKFLLPGESHALLPPVLYLTLVHNKGIAFGLFRSAETILFILITLSLPVLAALGFRIAPDRKKSQWGIGLILGGALGNWIDRLRFGAVIDFLDFRVWPVFNLADTAITAGVFLFFWEWLEENRKTKACR